MEATLLHIQIVQFLIRTPAHLHTWAPAHLHTCTHTHLHTCFCAPHSTILVSTPAMRVCGTCFTCQNIAHLDNSHHIVSFATMQTHVTHSSHKYTHIHSSFSFTSHYAILQQFRQKAAQHSTAQHSTAQRSAAQRSAAQRSAAQRSASDTITSKHITPHRR